MSDLSPGLILILGALFVPVLRGHLRSAWMLALPLVAVAHLAGLPAGEGGRFELMGMTLTTLRVDGLSVVFGYAFLAATFLGLVYSLHVEDPLQHVAALIYAGSAVGAVFAGDLVTLFVFWEGTAIGSVFLIWASRNEGAVRAGVRYLLFQVLSGLLVLEGLLILYHETGDIAFGEIGLDTAAGWMILLGFGIKAAFPLLHGWIVDAYPKATVGGAVMLSAFTTKLAIYALARGFPGAEILVPVGVVMVIFPLVYAAVEDDIRRALVYVLISQLGFMVVGVGIGSELALAGVAAHAFAHVVYNLLLFMVAGAVLHATGTAALSQLGDLRRDMPWTAGFSLVGAAAIAAPLFCGFVGKALIISAAMESGQVWTWLVLLAGGAGAFLFAGVRIAWFAFFAPRPQRPAHPATEPREAPANMLVAMGLTAGLCLFVGIAPDVLYGALPYPVDYAPYSAGHVVSQVQILALAGLAFALLLRFGVYPRPRPGGLLDVDWLYRSPGRRAAIGAYHRMAQARGWALGALGGGLTAVLARLQRHYGPHGLLGRSWSTGVMAMWTTVLLAVWLLAYYV